MMAAITAARAGHKVLLLEKLSKIGAKLKATGVDAVTLPTHWTMKLLWHTLDVTAGS